MPAFLLAATVLAFLVNLAGAPFGVPPEWRIAAFGATVIALAFVVGHKMPINGDCADLAYYLLTILGIVLLFFDQGAERQRITLSADYAVQTGELDQFHQKRPDIERVSANIGPLLARFRQAALSPETAARREKALKDCEALEVDEMKRQMQRRFEEQQRRIQQIPVSPGTPTPFRPLRLDEGPVPPVDCRKLVGGDPDIEALARVTTPRELVDIIKRLSPVDLKEQLGLDLGSLTVEDVATYLDLALDGKSVKDTLDSQERQMVDRQAEVKQSFDRLRLGPDVSQGVRLAARLRQFVWPYVLLCAAGLKLARKPYLALR